MFLSDSMLKEVLPMRYRSQLPLFMLVLALLTLLASMASAQTATTTTVSGSVIDTNGAAVSGATVKLTDIATNNERADKTDAQGRYNFYAGSPGTFKVTVTAPSFKTSFVGDVPAGVSKVPDVNVTID